MGWECRQPLMTVTVVASIIDKDRIACIPVIGLLLNSDVDVEQRFSPRRTIDALCRALPHFVATPATPRRPASKRAPRSAQLGRLGQPPDQQRRGTRSTAMRHMMRTFIFVLEALGCNLAVGGNPCSRIQDQGSCQTSTTVKDACTCENGIR